MFSGICRINLTGWGGQSSSIVVVIPEECRDVIDCFISSVHNIYVGCGNVDNIIVNSVFNFLPAFLRLEVHYFWLKLNICRDI